MAERPKARTRGSRGDVHGGLAAFAGRESVLSLPKLGPLDPGRVEIYRTPETVPGDDEEELTVLGTNTAGLWLVLAPDGSIHLVDDCERELGTRVFESVGAFAAELSRQNPAK